MPTDQIEKGKKLFEKNGCVNCHSFKVNNNIKQKFIKLRIGYPFLSKEFFSKRVLNGTHQKNSLPLVYNFQWRLTADKKKYKKVPRSYVPMKMPAYKFNPKELDALYAYVSSSKVDVKKKYLITKKDQNEDLSDINTDDELFNYIRINVFETSCRHCHSVNAKSRGITKKVFSFSGNQTAEEFFHVPVRGAPFKTHPQFKKVFTPNSSCTSSIVTERLIKRHAEWDGQFSSMRGMPLMLAPIPLGTIKKLLEWGKRQCPSPMGDLCPHSYCQKSSI